MYKIELQNELFRSLKVCLLAGLLSQAACFRYTPSRNEIAALGDNTVAGPEAFTAYQNELKGRLDSLLKERQALLSSDATQSYQIGAGDSLKVEVFGFSDLSGGVDVSDIGEISLPLVGSVQASGKSVSDLQQELTVHFKRYVRDPKVRLNVEKFAAYRVSVVGSVVRPGSYPLKRQGYLLTELLADVGGTKENSGGRLYLIPAPSLSRPTDRSSGIEIDLEELNGTLDRPPLFVPLVAGDNIIVPEAGQFRVDGEVLEPGSFAVTRRTSTLSAVAAAGGFTYAANVNEVEVIRDIGAGKKASMTVDLEKVAFRGSPDVSLRDGDLIVVPSSPGRFRARQLVEAFRSVFRGGVSGSLKYQ